MILRWPGLLRLGLGIAFMVLFGLGLAFMGKPVGKFALGFVFVFLMAVLAQLFAAQANIKDAGLGYAAWAIIFGLLVSNTIDRRCKNE